MAEQAGAAQDLLRDRTEGCLNGGHLRFIERLVLGQPHGARNVPTVQDQIQRVETIDGFSNSGRPEIAVIAGVNQRLVGEHRRHGRSNQRPRRVRAEVADVGDRKRSLLQEVTFG